MKKCRILFDIKTKWVGGIYYFKNILYEICSSEKMLSACEPVVLCNTDVVDMFKDFSEKAEIISYDKDSRFQRFYKRCRCILKSDLIYAYHKYKFDAFNLLGSKAIYWIPDFQECYYPQFFSKDALEQRRVHHEMIARSNNPIVFSSQSAKDDFVKFFEPTNKKIYVVPFVSAIENEVLGLSNDFCFEVLKKYNLNDSHYVLISNQFWQHKNHIVVFEAIAEAKERGLFRDLLFVFTGELKDDRNTEYCLRLKKLISESDIENKIRILGFIDRKDQLALMHKAKLIIQPSLFEGWGTVVEDAKVLDKTVVLSDIPVHREQINDKCFMFNANDPQNLVEVLDRTLNDPQKDDIEKGVAKMKKDAERYSECLLRLIDDFMKRKSGKFS